MMASTAATPEELMRYVIVIVSVGWVKVGTQLAVIVTMNAYSFAREEYSAKV